MLFSFPLAPFLAGHGTNQRNQQANEPYAHAFIGRQKQQRPAHREKGGHGMHAPKACPKGQARRRHRHHSIEVLKHVPKDAVLRLAALLHDVAKPDAKTTDEQGVDHFKGHDAAGVLLADEILTRLRIDNHTKDAVLHLIRFHDSRPAATKRSVRRAMAAVGRDVFLALLALMRADAMGQAPAHGRESLERYDAVEALYHEIVQAQDAVSVAELAINGRDLLELGISGVAVGDALQRALDYVLEHPEQNQKAVLLEGIKNKIF